MHKQKKQHVPVQESTKKKGAVEGEKAIPMGKIFEGVVRTKYFGSGAEDTRRPSLCPNRL